MPNYFQGWDYVTGLDEVGRGSLAGPIMAAAVTFAITRNNENPIPGVKDSKRFHSKTEMRKICTDIMRATEMVDVHVGSASVEEINSYGIDKANALAFERSVAGLRCGGFLIVDGMNPVRTVPYKCQLVAPKADRDHWQVSAASIVAKVMRDELMEDLGKDWPAYGWFKNSGYGSERHMDALVKHGPTPHHRTKFIQKILGGSKEALLNDLRELANRLGRGEP